ncbi:MAG: hypothetical protein ACREGF_03170, partial [Candidatus Saccharimonadales bacterium]
SVAMTAQECAPNLSSPADVPAGTGVSAGGQTYITQNDTSFHPVGYKGNCVSFTSNDQTQIIAQQAGSKYNVNNSDFTVNGRSDVSASGSASGGTDNVVKVVQQADIDSATKQITAQNKSSIKSSLANELTAGGYQPIQATFTAGSPPISTSAKLGDQADNVTVTSTTTYFMYGVSQKDLKTLVDNNINGQINTAKQGILNDGLGSAQFSVVRESASSASLKVQTSALIGPKLNVASLKSQAAGQKSGDVKTVLGANPGVTSVSVRLSPFWVSAVPKNTSKITIKFTKAGSNK